MSFSEEHAEQQQDVIAEALQELITGDNGSEQAYERLVAAIDSWLNYYTGEAKKWQALRDKIVRSDIG